MGFFNNVVNSINAKAENANNVAEPAYNKGLEMEESSLKYWLKNSSGLEKAGYFRAAKKRGLV